MYIAPANIQYDGNDIDKVMAEYRILFIERDLYGGRMTPMRAEMRVIQINTALNDMTGEYRNMVTVRTAQGNVFNIDLTRTYSIIDGGPTAEDVEYIIETVYALEHRTLKEERARRLFNAAIDKYIERTST
jgi:hypothetical protein